MKNLLVAAFFCFISQPLVFSQVLYSGQVLSEETGVPIEFANVIILSQDSSFLAGGVTSENGMYSFNLEQKKIEGQFPQLIKVTSVGYESLIKPLASYPRENARLLLKPHVEHLQEVTVIGKRRVFSLKDGAFIANVAAVPSLKNSGSMDDLLNRIPFVQGGGGSYSVLGTGGDATLYLDGQKVQDASILQQLRSQDIASIEVINTPGVQYKASTKSVIKINTIKKHNSTSLSVSQYALMQNKLSTYSGGNVSQSNKRTYWNFNVGYSHTGMSNRSSDYYALSNDGSLSETSSTANIINQSDFLIGGFNLNLSPSKETNIGVISNFNIGNAKFDIHSSGLIHSENGVEQLNTPFSSQLNTKPYKSTSSLYYNGKIGKTSVNVTDEFLFGRSTKLFSYDEIETSSSIETTGKQSFAMNSIMLSFQTPIKSVMLGYGTEMTVSFNRNSLLKNEEGLTTDVANSNIKNKQTLLASFLDLRTKWKKMSLYAGLRYEYEMSSYIQNGIKPTFQKSSPHFVSPTLSLSYFEKDFQMTLSYRRNINRPAYSSLNNFVIIENQYIYQQGNPFLLNQTKDVVQLIGTYKKFSFNLSCNYIQNTTATVLTKHESNENVVLKRVINIPNYSMFFFGLNWKDSFGPYSPSIGLNCTKQFVEYHGHSYNRPMIRLTSEHYIDLGRGWRSSLFASYTTRSNNLFLDLSRRWNYNVMLSKSFKNFTFDFTLQNLFLDNKLYRLKEMSGIVSKEIEEQDFSGVSLNISYRFNSVRASYRNRKTSNESKRF
ncbi:outer membrane beta-barrel protein [Porphyromonas gingivalis]|uniref:outer membrane beta-barrel protein n=1 Tax=Porphyromonas gingivalis TaxID=837 RepID=UPI002658CD6A|nr:outer membrane beta-barrel protein [Porphyromonas gingivalis]MDP0531646.1 outer membrane beta-barrel protein [Porphyromonas gingivalis]MDP0624661.1 outer membrane beta-barrel protein [Porphyromonas gingivalis]WKD51837.1 outer membrane beta-barrel protein [Porphyromonas gingivalis]WKD53887.1 outer membrane beta-barrel protein [Porphyromonas gingivalis]